MDNVLVDIDGMLGCEDAPAADCVINVDEVLQALSNMKPNKYDGMNELSSDYFYMLVKIWQYILVLCFRR